MLLLITLFAVFVAVNGDGTCEQKLKDVKLMPRYFDVGTNGDLQVFYDGNFPLQCGNKMSVTKGLKAPTVTYDLQGKCENASIIFFDPDTPIPIEEKRIFLHWFVVNIPVSDLKKGYSNEESGKIVAKYFPPAAPTGNHRYTFCLYCQEKYIKKAKCIKSETERMGVHPKDLAKKYHLGNPIACNFVYLVAVETDLKDVPLAKDISDANEKLGNRDESPLK